MISIYTSGEYRKDHPNWHDEDASWKTAEVLKMLKKNNISPRSILDLGCGTGTILKGIAQKLKIKKAVGYEHYKEVLNNAKKKNPKLQFSRNIPRGKFDLVLLIDVIEHVENPQKLLRQCKKTADYKIFHIPLALSFQARLRRKPIEYARIHSGHLFEFTKSSALNFLKENNYEIIDFSFTRGSILSPVKSRRQKILNIFRIVFFPIFPDLTSKLLGGFSLIVLTK